MTETFSKRNATLAHWLMFRGLIVIKLILTYKSAEVIKRNKFGNFVGTCEQVEFFKHREARWKNVCEDVVA
ncbi:MAG: hypothetical protein ACTS7D_00875 [Candidatus Hodgkinia cicadicola]